MKPLNAFCVETFAYPESVRPFPPASLKASLSKLGVRAMYTCDCLPARIDSREIRSIVLMTRTPKPNYEYYECSHPLRMILCVWLIGEKEIPASHSERMSRICLTHSHCPSSLTFRLTWPEIWDTITRPKQSHCGMKDHLVQSPAVLHRRRGGYASLFCFLAKRTC